MAATILIVDDDPVQRRLLEAMIRRFGYEPVVAESGDTGLRIMLSAEGEKVDVVVLDSRHARSRRHRPFWKRCAGRVSRHP